MKNADIAMYTAKHLITSPELTAGILHRLTSLGVRSSIDDFGTGYSSLSSLCELPVNELKIDRKFVAGMMIDGRHSAIVELTIHLGRRLALAVVAEGVEDEQTLTLLGKLGCPYVQGFHIGKPMPADECETWLVERIERIRAAPARRETQEGSEMAFRPLEAL